MKKLRNSSGLTLLEMLASLLILVILVVGMGTAMNSGAKLHQEAVFASDSAALARILNTALGDILRYSCNGTDSDLDIKINGQPDDQGNPVYFLDAEGQSLTPEEVGFVFTNPEYGAADAYFCISEGVLVLRSLRDHDMRELVNAGAYPNLLISNFEIVYVPEGSLSDTGEVLRGGYFHIRYHICSEIHRELTHSVETAVRLMNSP